MSSGRILAQILGKSQLIFFHASTTNLTQHDSRKPDDRPKSIDYHHHLDMSRDDGMDEHGIDWIYGCHLVGFWLKSWANHSQFLSSALTTNLTQHGVLQLSRSVR
jgi:hypothetical protein